QPLESMTSQMRKKVVWRLAAHAKGIGIGTLPCLRSKAQGCHGRRGLCPFLFWEMARLAIQPTHRNGRTAKVDNGPKLSANRACPQPDHQVARRREQSAPVSFPNARRLPRLFRLAGSPQRATFRKSLLERRATKARVNLTRRTSKSPISMSF